MIMAVQESQILVNFVKAHRIVASSTVSWWMKECLSIDKSLFKDHSI